MTKFKKIISSFLVIGMLSSCLQSMVFANAPTVTWKETHYGGNDAVDQLPSGGVGYNAETGTFGTEGRTITDSSTKGDANTNHTYYLGVELPQKVETGTVIVEAEFSDMALALGGSYLNLFDLSNEANGWKSKAKSGVIIQESDILINNANRQNAVNKVQRFKFVAARANTDADWSVKFYHFDNSEPLYTYTVSKTDLPDIKYITNNSWVAGGRSIALTVNKFKVRAFDANYGADFSAAYVPDANDSTDRIATINVSGTAVADINAVDAYIVNGDTGVETKLDNVSYENGVAQVTVPKSFYGNISIKLVLKTDGGEFSRTVSFGDNNPFLESPIIAVLDSSLAYAACDVSLTPEVDFKFNGTVVPTQSDSTPDDFSDNVKIYEYNNETLGKEVSSDNYTVVKSQDETNPAYDHLKITVTQPLEEEVTYAIVMDKIKKAGTEDIDCYSQEVIRTFTTLKEFKITANATKTGDTAALDVTVRNASLQVETKPYLIIMALMSDTNGVRKVHKTYYAEYPSETLELQASGAYAKELVVPTKNFTSVPANGYLKVMLWSKVNGPVEYTDEVIIPLNN